jgi:hypothetical protein
MTKCPRCGHYHNGEDSSICTVCWEDMGQLSFEMADDGEFFPVIDTVFDREEEARGYQ